MVRDAIIPRWIKQSPEISTTKDKADFHVQAILETIGHNMRQDPFISDATILVYNICTNTSLAECRCNLGINVVKSCICVCILLAGLVLPACTIISIILKKEINCVRLLF